MTTKDEGATDKCSVCGGLFAKNYLSGHIREMHPSPPQTTDNQELDRILFKVAGVGAAARETGVDPILMLTAPAYIEAKAALNQYWLDLIGPDEDLTIKDIFGDDPRNNIGGGEMEAMHNQNLGRRKLRAELRTKLGQNP